MTNKAMKNLINLILLLNIIASCEDSSLPRKNDKVGEENIFHKNTSEIKEAKFNKDSADYYINLIANKNEVHSKHIGFGGGKSQIYNAYERLRDNLNTEDIFPLLSHDSAAVRIYAYNAIVEKDSTLAKRAWNEIKGKNDQVYTQSGCIGMNETLKNVIKGFH